MAVEVLHEEKDHVFLWLGKDESGLEEGVQSNQYLIVDSGQGLLIDPGGFGVFSRVLVNLSHYIDPQSIRDIFLCHQDPDVGGSLGSWFEMTPATVHVSELWIRFLLHYGVSDIKRFKGIPDGGGSLSFRQVGKWTLSRLTFSIPPEIFICLTMPPAFFLRAISGRRFIQKVRPRHL